MVRVMTVFEQVFGALYILFILVFFVIWILLLIDCRRDMFMGSVIESTDSTNLVGKKYPFNWDYDDKSIDSFIQSLKGQEYQLRKNQKLSDSLKSVINEKFNILDVKNTVINEKDGKFYVPLFIGRFQENIVRRVILVISIYNNTFIIENVILPKNVEIEDVQDLPAFNKSTLIKTSTLDYKDISDGLLKDDLILTKEIIPKKEKKEKNDSMCYGIPEFQKIPNKEQCHLFGGVWDKPVKHNEDCPFYKKNVNYPNNRGGVKNGRCELPLGMKLLGFRYYDLQEIYAPFCYNCNANANVDKCCDKQKNPDYAFSGDKPERAAHGL